MVYPMKACGSGEPMPTATAIGTGFHNQEDLAPQCLQEFQMINECPEEIIQINRQNFL